MKKFLPDNITVQKTFAGFLIGIGVVASFLDQIGDRLLMKHIFGTYATQLPAAVYFLLVLGLIALYTAVGFFINRAIKKI